MGEATVNKEHDVTSCHHRLYDEVHVIVYVANACGVGEMSMVGARDTRKALLNPSRTSTAQARQGLIQIKARQISSNAARLVM